MDDATTQNKVVIRPPSVWLTQIWLIFNAIPGLIAVALFCYNIARGAFTHLPTLHLSGEGRLALLKFSALIGMSVLALITFWALQKRARAGRRLALFCIAFVVAKNTYALVLGRPELNLVTSPIYLFQLVMVYRFSLGKSEKAFLSN